MYVWDLVNLEYKVKQRCILEYSMAFREETECELHDLFQYDSWIRESECFREWLRKRICVIFLTIHCVQREQNFKE